MHQRWQADMERLDSDSELAVLLDADHDSANDPASLEGGVENHPGGLESAMSKRLSQTVAVAHSWARTQLRQRSRT